MSSVINADCPHCGTKSVAFNQIKERHSSQDNVEIFAFCGYCNKGIILAYNHFETAGLTTIMDGVRNGLISMYPSPQRTDAPEHSPENVARFFKQGMDNKNSHNWDAAGAMFRKTLDVGLKEKFPHIKGTLYERIKKAADDNEITKELEDWAHQIRSLGNDAVHAEDPFTKEETYEISDFTYFLLTYIFTMPGQLQAARKKTSQIT